MILYGSYTSPFVRHTRIALIESGLDFRFQQANINDAAKASPSMKLPYLEDGDLLLTDSTVIIRHVRDTSGQPYLPTVTDHQLFCLATHVLDSAISLMYMHIVDGLKATDISSTALTPGSGNTANRHQARVESGLAELNTIAKHLNERASDQPYTDGELRLACLLSWGLFRRRIDISEHRHLQNFLSTIEQYAVFNDTAPHE